MPSQLDSLPSVLNNTQLAQKDNPLYQFLNSLISILKAQANAIAAASATPGSSGTTVTVNNTTNNPIAPGDIGSSDSSHDPFPIPGPPGINGKDGLTIPGLDGKDADDVYFVLQSASGGSTPAVFVDWSVLTNGDVVNPELIFAGGDVVMVHVP